MLIKVVVPRHLFSTINQQINSQAGLEYAYVTLHFEPEGPLCCKSEYQPYSDKIQMSNSFKKFQKSCQVTKTKF